MRLTEIRVAGFGGQGVILSAVVLGKAASIYENGFATMTQNFGPEARGGACSAQLIVSDSPVLYPYTTHPDIMVIMSQEAYNRFAHELKPGGMLINLVGEMDRRAARKARVRGVLFGMKYDTRDLARIASLAADGTIDPHVSKILSLDAVRKGLDLNQRGRSHGKVILRVG